MRTPLRALAFVAVVSITLPSLAQDPMGSNKLKKSHTMYPGDLSVEDRIPVAVQKALAAKGHKLTVSGPWSLGANAAIVVDVERGVIGAGADVRNDACAWAR